VDSGPEVRSKDFRLELATDHWPLITNHRPQQKNAPRKLRAGRQGERDRRKFLGCFSPLLDGFELLAVFLRVTDDLALRQAVDPPIVRDGAPFAAGTDGAAVQDIGGPLLGSLLLPTAARGHVENTDISIHKKLERSIDLVHAIEFRRSLGAKTFEPGRVDEIGEQDVVDLVAETVIFAGVADFVSIKDAGGVEVLHEDGEVDIGVTQHLEEFVAGGDGPGCAGFQIAGDENFSDGQSLSGEVVIAKSIGLIGIVEQDQPPASSGWSGAFGKSSEFGVGAPDGSEVIGDLLLESSDDRDDIRVGQHGALVDYGDLDDGGLRGLRHRCSLLGKNLENAQRELRDSVMKSL